jgi:hypothetical protein
MQEAQDGKEILKNVADIPLPGPAVRFDYRSPDVEYGRLYIAHMVVVQREYYHPTYAGGIRWTSHRE